MMMTGDERPRLVAVLADGQAVYRTGLRAALSCGKDVRVAGEAASGTEAMRLCLRHKPDVLIFELEMPEGGYELLRELQKVSPGTRAVVLSSRPTAEAEERAIRAGASGFLPKSTSEASILQATRAVARGEIWAGRRSTSRLLKSRAGGAGRHPGPSLSEREWEVLKFLALGLRNRDIAGHLGSSEKTVASQVASIVGKLGVRGRVCAAITGRRLLERRQTDLEVTTP